MFGEPSLPRDVSVLVVGAEVDAFLEGTGGATRDREPDNPVRPAAGAQPRAGQVRRGGPSASGRVVRRNGLVAQWTTTSTPATARSSPSPVSTSPRTASTPSGRDGRS